MAAPNLKVVEDTNVDKSKALEAALGQIERAFGKGSIMRLGANEQAVEIETIPTGCLGLDIALGVGGLPKGRIVEIYAWDNGFKSRTVFAPPPAPTLTIRTAELKVQWLFTRTGRQLCQGGNQCLFLDKCFQAIMQRRLKGAPDVSVAKFCMMVAFPYR